MLLPPTSHSSRSSRSTRFGRERRHVRKLAAVCRLLGILCAIVAVIFFVSSQMQEKKVARKQLMVSMGFLAATPTLLILGVGLDWWKHRFYGRGQRRRSSSNNSENGNGNGSGNQRAEKLPAE